MEMDERSKGKLSHASSYASSRADRYHGGVGSAESYEYWKTQRVNPSFCNRQRERRIVYNRRQAGGTDNPGANYYIPDPYRRHKKLIPPNSSHVNYSSIENTDTQYRCPQNHRVSRNKISNVNGIPVMRKGNEFKEDVEADADIEDDDDDDLGGEQYYEVNARDGVEENQEESCGSETEKEREDLEEGYEISPPSDRFPKKYEKDPMSILQRLKMLDLAQERLKLQHVRHFQKRYQEMETRRCSQDIPEHDVTDEATEDDDEISPHLLPIRKNMKQPINFRQPNSWSSSRNPDKYNIIRSSHNYHYPRKNENAKSGLEPFVESYRQRGTCQYCGGTGKYPESVVPRKNNCRVHESTKVSFNTNEKFGVDGESGEPGDSCSGGRRNSPRSNFPISSAALSSQKSRRSRNTRSPNRG